MERTQIYFQIAPLWLKILNFTNFDIDEYKVNLKTRRIEAKRKGSGEFEEFLKKSKEEEEEYKRKVVGIHFQFEDFKFDLMKRSKDGTYSIKRMVIS
jgi:hypothetical protein